MNIIEQVNQQAVLDIMGDQEWMATIALYVKRLRDGLFCREYVDVITQKWERYPFDIYDALPFSQVWVDLCLAKIVCARIRVGHTPYGDKNIKRNQEILNRLSGSFCGEFWGGTQDEDGYIDVSREIELDMTNLETSKRITKMVSGRFPLEVGYISASKTRLYLAQDGGRLARWPYGSEDIWLLYRVDEASL